MISADYSILSPGIDALATQDCRLIIKVNGQFLHYIIIDNNNAIVALQYYQFSAAGGKTTTEWLQELLADDQLLTKEWKQVTIIYAVPENQLLPGWLDANSAAELLALTHGDLQHGVSLTGSSEKAATYTAFRVPAEMHQLLQHTFTNAHTIHYYDWWMKHDTQDGVYALFYPNELFIKVIKAGELQLIQSYACQSPEDAAYYLLTIYTNYHFSPEHDALQIGGMIVSDSALYGELLKYFRTVQAIAPPASLSLAPGFSDFPSHFFSPILKLAVCAS